MICKECGEKFDEELFPVCPYCLTPNAQKETVVDESAESDETIIDKHKFTLDEVEENKSTSENKCATKNNESENNMILEDESRSVFPVINVPFFSMRTKNLLRRNGIFYLSDLKLFLKKNEIMDIHGLGETTKTEIEFVLKNEHLLIDKNVETQKKDVQDETRVSSVYSANKYKIFVDYCENSGITHMSDFVGFDFMSLKHVQGIGDKKIEDIVRLFESYCEGDITEEYPVTLFSNLNEQILDLDMIFLYGLGIKSKQIDQLTNRGLMKICDLQNISVNVHDFIFF